MGEVATGDDPKIVSLIAEALDDAVTVAHVGAGTGVYEPRGRSVVAVDPSEALIGLRPDDAAPAICARVDALPFRDSAFDAALAIALHRWSDARVGLGELRRVARRRVVVLTVDVEGAEEFWLSRDYLPSIATMDRERFPAVADVMRELGGRGEIVPVPIPADCRDGFPGAYWRRPGAYLDRRLTSVMTTFDLIPDAELADGLLRLADDLASGAWRERYGHLLRRRELDLGYRLVVARLD
jgi:hypothetical protein